MTGGGRSSFFASTTRVSQKAERRTAYVITTDAIFATGFDDVYTVTAYKGATKGASVTYSVKSYVYTMQDNGNAYMRALAEKTYNYGLAAKAFVAALEA